MDAFWAFMGVLVVQATGIIILIINNSNARKAREELKNDICNVQADLQTVRLTPEQMEMLREGAGRIAVNEYKANTQPSQLSGK